MAKVALVTAAGSGMGEACARRLASEGFSVAVSSSSGAGERLGIELGGIGFTASNDSASDLERVVSQTLDAYGRIDAVVNSCGNLPTGDLLEITDVDWHHSLDMVLMPVVRLSRLVTPIFLRQGAGCMVNISTYSAFEPSLTYPVSSTLRAALGSFAKLYSDRYGPDNIRMNNILPGFIKTRWPENSESRARIPLRRYGSPDDIAATVAFLVSEEGGYITGQNIKVDGGLARSV